jgi:hypothetical protein
MPSDAVKGLLRIVALHRGSLGAQVQFEKSRHHDYGLRAPAVFEHGELDGFSASDKEAATKTVLIADNPVAAAVLAHQEWGSSSTAQWGRFTFVHGTSPFEEVMG